MSSNSIAETRTSSQAFSDSAAKRLKTWSSPKLEAIVKEKCAGSLFLLDELNKLMELEWNAFENKTEGQILESFQLCEVDKTIVSKAMQLNIATAIIQKNLQAATPMNTSIVSVPNIADLPEAYDYFRGLKSSTVFPDPTSVELPPRPEVFLQRKAATKELLNCLVTLQGASSGNYPLAMMATFSGAGKSAFGACCIDEMIKLIDNGDVTVTPTTRRLLETAIPIFIDFNGRGDSILEFEERGDNLLGPRLFARGLLNTTTHLAFSNNTFKASRNLFLTGKVVEMIAEKHRHPSLQPDEKQLVVVHIDEFQMGIERIEKRFKVDPQEAIAIFKQQLVQLVYARSNCLVLVLLTGTTQKEIEFSASRLSLHSLYLEPLTDNQSIAHLKQRYPHIKNGQVFGIHDDWFNKDDFLRLIADFAGVPRMLETAFYPESNSALLLPPPKHAVDLTQIIEGIVHRFRESSPFLKIVRPGYDGVMELIRLTLVPRQVSYDHKIGEKTTVKQLANQGVLLLKPVESSDSDNQVYVYVSVPPILLYSFIMTLNSTNEPASRHMSTLFKVPLGVGGDGKPFETATTVSLQARLTRLSYIEPSYSTPTTLTTTTTTTTTTLFKVLGLDEEFSDSTSRVTLNMEICLTANRFFDVKQRTKQISDDLTTTPLAYSIVDKKSSPELYAHLPSGNKLEEPHNIFLCAGSEKGVDAYVCLPTSEEHYRDFSSSSSTSSTPSSKPILLLVQCKNVQEVKSGPYADSLSNSMEHYTKTFGSQYTIVLVAVISQQFNISLIRNKLNSEYLDKMNKNWKNCIVFVAGDDVKKMVPFFYIRSVAEMEDTSTTMTETSSIN